MAKRLTIQIVKIRKAIANYMYSEGCDCCEGSSHDSEKDILAKMLNVPKYDDGSGYDFGKFRDKEKRS